MVTVFDSRNGQAHSDECNIETAVETCSLENKRTSSPSSSEICVTEEEAVKLLEVQSIGTDGDKGDGIVVEESKEPIGGWKWFIILGCLILRMAIGGIGRSHGLFYKRFIERFHQSATATTWVTSLSHIVRLGTGPGVSILCNRFTERKLVFIGAGLLSIALLMSGFAPNQPFLYFSYGVVGGLGRSLALTPCPLLLGHYFEKRRSLAFGLASAGFGLGGFIITPIIELMFQTYGFTGTFIMLSGIASHIFVCACLFRPISLQRRLVRKRLANKNRSGSALNTTESIIKDSDDAEMQRLGNLEKSSLEMGKCDEHCDLQNKEKFENGIVQEVSDKNGVQRTNSKEQGTGLDDEKSDKDEIMDGVKKKKKLISWSIIKDIRFLTFILCMFCNSLPAMGLYLPTLAISRGVTEFEAAYLLSINAGMDTAFRVISGFILDMKVFRSKRPIIYNAVTFLRAIIVFLLPSMRSFAGFGVLMGLEGAVQGAKNAQSAVIMIDLLGLDKFASSIALSMSVQAAGMLIGPTVSGLLKDIYGSYDGAFYFGGSAIVAGAFILAGGNIRKIYVDRQEERNKRDRKSDNNPQKQ